MSLLEAVADVTEMRKADPTPRAQLASHIADKTEEIASLDRVSRHLLPRESGRPCSETKAQSVDRECEKAHIATSDFVGHAETA